MKSEDYLSKYAEKKVNKYSDDFKLQDYDFQPMIVDTLGRWDDDASRVITKMASLFARNNSQDFSQVKNQIFQKLSISIQASIAKAIFHRTQIKSVFMDDQDSNFSSSLNPIFNAENLVNGLSVCPVSSATPSRSTT